MKEILEKLGLGGDEAGKGEMRERERERERKRGEVRRIYTSKATAEILKSEMEDSQTVEAA